MPCTNPARVGLAPALSMAPWKNRNMSHIDTSAVSSDSKS